MYGSKIIVADIADGMICIISFHLLHSLTGVMPILEGRKSKFHYHTPLIFFLRVCFGHRAAKAEYSEQAAAALWPQYGRSWQRAGLSRRGIVSA